MSRQSTEPLLPLSGHVLAIDASAGPCSAAVAHRGILLAQATEAEPQRQAARLVPMIEEVLARAGIGYDALEGIAATTGPGSFTGIRIGLAAARGVALAAAKPLRGFTSLELLAFQASQEGEKGDGILVAMVAGKGQVFYQPFDTSTVPYAMAEAKAVEIAQLGAYLPQAGSYTLCGSGQEHLLMYSRGASLTASPILAPSAASLCILAGLAPGTAMADALYLRMADAKLPAAAS